MNKHFKTAGCSQSSNLFEIILPAASTCAAFDKLVLTENSEQRRNRECLQFHVHFFDCVSLRNALAKKRTNAEVGAVSIKRRIKYKPLRAAIAEFVCTTLFAMHTLLCYS